MTAPMRRSTGSGRPEHVDGRERKLALIAWMSVCLIWGTTYLAIRVSVETIPPWLMSGVRWLSAGGAIAAFQAARGERVFTAAHWRGTAFLGFFMFVLGNGCVVLAEVFVPSGLAAMIVASQGAPSPGSSSDSAACSSWSGRISLAVAPPAATSSSE